ncbi:hypothetical protein HH310_01600 [Actinoplanes sp. TBRC 11911]|uniref:hypothetical protein n=1 Tax=Actinoplanes sp. TBRC 11911 TaxID=2729386 RepID=UPI00145FA286|nr:hypothetical protein [Actinoplanes sp. TBRC 11911]NMO49896.1 hypothetical protein [Actinoplanes sp. TBRC 11911]
MRTLRLIREARIHSLLPAGTPHRLEASGVVAADGRYRVIFDNLRAVAVIDTDLDRPAANTLVPTEPGRASGYEDIARDPITGHLFLLIEAEKRDNGLQARVEEYDEALQFVSAGWLEYPLTHANKGMEGLEIVRRNDGVYLLGLHESGGLLVFRRGRQNWKHVATAELPVRLADYSAVSTAGTRIALVSQESSAMWVGAFATDTWQAAGPGDTYLFPRGRGGELLYRTAEGVCWLGPERVVVVSDRGKPGGEAKEEMLHVFAL